MNLIGLGKAGCRVVRQLEGHSEYAIYKIDTGLKGKKKDGIYDFPAMATPEEYEESCPSMRHFLKAVSGQTMFFTSGADMVCAASLRVLETIKTRASVTVVYIQPDPDLVGTTARLMDTAALNVFQEYARSGAVDRVVLISQESLSSAVGEVSVAEFNDRTDGLLSSTLHIINIMDNTDPVLGNRDEKIDKARISTIGMASIEHIEENLLYMLQYPNEKMYYYLIPREEIETNEKLMNKILKQVKERVRCDKIKVNFGVYATDYEDAFVYVVANSSVIQGREIE